MKRMWNRKRAGALVLALTLAVLTLSGCGGKNDSQEKEKSGGDSAEKTELSAPVKVAALSGPTGIGMVFLMDQPDRYDVTIYQSPDEIVGKLLSGDVDAAAVPSNLGAVLYNKTDGRVKMLAVNTGGVLYLLENGSSVKSLEDLKGKTILASGKGGAPEYILNRLLLDAGVNPEADVTIQWLANHADVSSTMLTQEGSIALLPEPFVSVTQKKGESATVAADLNQLWKDQYGQELPMGTLVGSKEMTENRSADLEIFLKDYEDSVKKVNQDPSAAAEVVAEKGIIADAGAAKQAIPRCNIVYLPGEQAKAALEPFYQVISDMEATSVGGKLPGEDFYYIGK